MEERTIIARVSVTKRNVWALVFLTIPLAVVAYFIQSLVDGSSAYSPHKMSGNLDVFFIVCLLTLVIHELVHAVIYVAYGVIPRFSAKLVAFVPVLTTSSKGAALPIKRMVSVGLGPLVLLSAVSLTLTRSSELEPYAIAAFYINFLGSIGDIFMVSSIAKHLGRDVYVQDTGSEFLVLKAK